MRRATISMVPGPTRVPAALLQEYLKPRGSPDLEREFLDLYRQTGDRLCQLLDCHPGHHDAVLMSGEAMVALWGAVNSTVSHDDKVLVISNGLFGSGFAGMARHAADVRLVESPFDEGIESAAVRDAIREFRPSVVTMVHCETPTGMLNPLEEIGRMVREESDALFIVDFVASAFGAPLSVSKANIDIGLLGTQKVLSLPPDLGILTVSERAWKKIGQVKYSGYDALLPFQPPLSLLPYTHNWSAVSALNMALSVMSVEESLERHRAAASLTRQRCVDMGLKPYVSDESLCSPTVSAMYVPDDIGWKQLDDRSRSAGLILGGNYGDLAGKVFRIGHMGSQADISLVEEALDILEHKVFHLE